ncbi:ATP-binding cassette domain-containing protein [Amaricoccus macauensis]|uniref:ATP-binding cassette domain-containing protein n=1 Tax=Amaricoccus macauensis TaxID=57001 RepID=UPI003C7D76AD
MVTDALIFEKVRIHRGDALLIALDAEVPPGDVLTIMGPSGSGKSTLLAFATGTLPRGFRAEGRVLLGGRDITALSPQERRIGMMFQEDVLFPHLSVGGNLAFGLAPDVRGRKARRDAVERALAEAGLEGMADRDPATLSGGQRARVALMRALLSAPRALALDEPFSKLDANLRAQIRDFVFDHARALGLPTLLVTHDPEDAAAAGGEVIQIAS